MLCLNISDIAVINVKGVDYRCIIHNMIDDRVYIYKIHINEINIKNHVRNCYFSNSIEVKKLETKNILTAEKKY